ncbi:MAG TPA: TolC family protein [Gemmatimonadales bacterium]|nr:TolC family protein [Gemmatimonadales bacterium]
MLLLLAASLLQAPADSGLTLASAWRTALRQRGAVLSASATMAEAGAQIRLAGQVPNPTASLSYTGAAPRGHFIVEQPLSWMLVNGPAKDAARAALSRSAVDSTLVLARLGADVSHAFYAVLGHEARYRLMLDQQQVADSVSGIARRRYRAGDIALLEVEQVELESRLQQQFVSAEADELAVARGELAAVIGWVGGSLPPTAGDLADGLDAGEVEPEAGTPPAVAGAQADSSLAALSVSVAERDRIPFPSLQVGTEWNDPADPGHAFGVVGISIPVPLWNWGGSQVAVARARAASAAASVTEARLDAQQAVNGARIRLTGQASRARFARDSLVPAAASLRQRALTAYRSGETGVIPVLEAIRREREVQLAEVDALVAFHEAAAALDELLGKTP